jgi:hypothetical protein
MRASSMHKNALVLGKGNSAHGNRRIRGKFFHCQCVGLLGLPAGQSSNGIPEVLGAEELDANFMLPGG